MNTPLIIVLLLLSPNFVSSGVMSYGACQTACNAGAVTCYTLGNTVFGVASNPACSAAQGKCMAVCAVSFRIPTP